MQMIQYHYNSHKTSPEQEGDEEKGDAEENSHSGDEVDEVGNFSGDGCLTHLKS